LRSLQKAARSVEATGRGAVEKFYWKRLAESSFGERMAWRKLANIPDKKLKLSQLDNLPENWLMDSSDWIHVFANVVSPEITDRFEKVILDVLDEGKVKDIAEAHPGPPKTLARSIAKSHEYMADFQSEDNARWKNFAKNFQSRFNRAPNKHEDFVWNIVDFARCSIVVPTARDLLKVKELLDKKLTVVCVKNGYSSNYRVKGSGYRDMKLLVQVNFDDLALDGIPNVQRKTSFICELQLLCESWLINKKTTSLSYKVLRAATLKHFFGDFAKYLGSKAGDNSELKVDATKVLKNGWVNLAKATDFSNIDADKLLMDSAQNNWEVAGVEILVEQLNANLEFKDLDGITPMSWCARKGYDTLLRRMIKLRADIETSDERRMTPLHHGARCDQEESVRILMEAGANQDAREYDGLTPLKIANTYSSRRIVNLLEGEEVPRANHSNNKQVTKMDKAMVAANERSLTNFFDIHNLKQKEVSKLFASQAVATSVENILQTLWFGADVDYVDFMGFTALSYAGQHGTYETVTLILEFGARLDIQDGGGWGPLHLGIQFGKLETVKALLDKKADIELKLNEGWSPLHLAAQYRGGPMTQLLLERGADVTAKLDSGLDVLAIASYRPNHQEIKDVIEAWKARN